MAFTDNAYNGRVIKEGLMPVKITLTDVCDVGDLIGFDGVSSNAWEKADADGKVPASLVAGEQCMTSGDEIQCYKMALIDFGSDCDATTGDTVYLSNTPGSYGATAGGWINQCVGECVSTQVAYIQPNHLGLFSYATTGTSWGAQIRAELEAGRVAEAIWGGMRIDFKAITTSTVTSDAYGLYIFGQLQQAAAGASSLIRLEDGCATSCGLDSYISFVGGSTSDPPDVLFEFSTDSPTNGAWERDGAAKTGAGGWLKLEVAGSTRYINMVTG